MDVYWLEQTAADVPATDYWLCANEAAHLATLRFPKRRADWRLGRWTAKQAVAAYCELENRSLGAAEIEIRAAESGAPEVFVSGQPAPVSISISHSNGVAICAVTAAGAAIGCDLEKIEARSDAFLADYFTEEERELVAQASEEKRAPCAALLWSAKESALKALQEGLRLDTRSVVVMGNGFDGEEGEWRQLRVAYANGAVFSGWWRRAGSFVQTIVTAAGNAVPVELA